MRDTFRDHPKNLAAAELNLLPSGIHVPGFVRGGVKLCVYMCCCLAAQSPHDSVLIRFAMLHDDLTQLSCWPDPGWRVHRAGRHVVESNQVHIIAPAVPCDAQQLVHIVKSRFTGQFSRDVGDADQRNRIHDNMAFFHRIPTANLNVWARPEPNAAPDLALPDSITKMSAEHHTEFHPKAVLDTGSSRAMAPT